MYNVKRIISLILISAICLSALCLVGCGEKQKESPNHTGSHISGTPLSKSDILSNSDNSENPSDSNNSSSNTVSEYLSTDPFSYQISIDGVVIQLPCNVSELEALGWKMSDDKADNTLDEGYTTSVNLYNGDDYITASIYNDGTTAVKYNEANVDDLYFSVHGIKIHSIAVCSGLTLGSAKDDVIAIYGNDADYEYVSDDGVYSTLEYKGESFYNKISFSFKNDIVIDIVVKSI